MSNNQGLYTDTAWSVPITFKDTTGAVVSMAGSEYVTDVISNAGAVVFQFKSTGAGATDGTIDKTQAASGILTFAATSVQHAALKAGFYRIHLKKDLTDDIWSAEGSMLIGEPGAAETYIVFDVPNTGVVGTLSIVGPAGPAGPTGSAGANATPISAIGYTLDGGGSVLATGTIGGGLQVPFNCTINSVTLLADQTGSVVVDIWKAPYASFPPTIANTITASAKPTLSAARKNTDATLTGWTTAIAAGDVLFFNINSVATITALNIILKVTKT